MKILAVDTSAKVLSAAICEDERLVAQTTLNTGNTHSETMLTVTEELISKAGMKPSDIELFACSNGPGSFTGIRIGVSFIKGISFGSGRPCVGVSTLEALAYNLRDYTGVICPVMDARRSQLYNAVFVSDGKNLKRMCEDRLITVDKLAEELSGRSEKIYFCGDGYYIAADKIRLDNVMQTSEILTYQSAYSIARLALDKYRRGEYVDDATLLPLYLRASQAERELNEKNKTEEKHD